MWRQSEIAAPILGEPQKEASHPLQNREDEISEQARARTTTKNEKDNIKVGGCLLSPHDILFLFF